MQKIKINLNKMEKIGELTLIKLLGQGSFGEVYLSKKKGKKEFFATKKIDRSFIKYQNYQRFLDNELNILKILNHPNIVKFEDLLITETNYYITMEFINGGDLSDCLKKYTEKYKMAFPEEIVQYIMRQIVEALNYMHNQKIIHRDLKLNNIMVHFDTKADKDNLNMMKAKIKIIDFGTATKLLEEKNFQTFTPVGTLVNMAPTILKKFKQDTKEGYDEKCDIWSIGTVCYELLIGKNLFNVSTTKELMERMEEGVYKLPNNVSKEIVYFLIAMLQYDSKKRLSSEELLKHTFLTKNIRDFEKINSEKATKLLDLSVDENGVSRNCTNGDKNININIQGGHKLTICPIPEENVVEKKQIYNNINRFNSKEYSNKNNVNISNYNNNINMKVKRHNSSRQINQNNYVNNLISFYGQKISSKGFPPKPKQRAKLGNVVGIPIPPKRIPQPQKVTRPNFAIGMPYYFARNLSPKKNVRSNSFHNINQHFIRWI